MADQSGSAHQAPRDDPGQSSGQPTTVRRATPVDPMPHVQRDPDVPRLDARNLPPELGPEAIAVVAGRTFMYSDLVGDVPSGTIGGLVHDDTRLLSRWMLTINGSRLYALRSAIVEHFDASFLLTNPPLPGLQANSVGVRRRRLLGDGFHEEIELHSFVTEPIDVELRLAIANDFADLFEIKTKVRDRSAGITRHHAADNCRIHLRYRNGSFEADTVVDAYPPAHEIDGDDLVWRLHLCPGDQWRCDLDVPMSYSRRESAPPVRNLDELEASAHDPVSDWRKVLPHVTSDSHAINAATQAATRDLVALRIRATAEGSDILMPAAGLPWYLTMFGRDTIITAYQTASLGTTLAKGGLLALAAQQGKVCDDFRDEEPGKILHEVRSGELTENGLLPFSPYYGSADATPLWLILLSEYWRWTGDGEQVCALREPAMAALNWIDEYGDRDGDGYVEYQTRSRQGLGNQCWRDSPEGVQAADGTVPVLPIATCELQGYVYDAKVRLAELADGPLGDPALAQRLRQEAAELYERFNRDFWIEERGGYYALGLDGDKKKIDSLTSNNGHLLWSGIVPPDRARMVADRLMSDALFSGWGVRTLSTLDAGYNPIGYHQGTVWPHDNSIIATGLCRYGFRKEANRIVMALLDAGAYSGYRLPEAFSGYPRSHAAFPIPYPTACSPQAWASGTPLLCVRAMLGLYPNNGTVEMDPCLPEGVNWIRVTRLHAYGKLWDVEARGTTGQVRPAR
ncbi:amylo-alpha-1,6-glucosidase [Rugosimonospora africana]|uniref:Amylo-alpha-1,6-glucosidase n=1 Tax=Rugosimonospora africana TaxID=556532 RepID=A0A8J3QT52_9ACTN|nr:glycogen debranching N-terminal domain-containing protein [Rugosimonospora africana]GIH16995.1 amylo-alpha-1,6-glucosidase [Rugosimonospora africana]